MFIVKTDTIPFTVSYDNVKDAIVTADHITNETHTDTVIVFPNGEEQRHYFAMGMVLVEWVKL